MAQEFASSPPEVTAGSLPAQTRNISLRSLPREELIPLLKSAGLFDSFAEFVAGERHDFFINSKDGDRILSGLGTQTFYSLFERFSASLPERDSVSNNLFGCLQSKLNSRSYQITLEALSRLSEPPLQNLFAQAYELSNSPDDLRTLLGPDFAKFRAYLSNVLGLDTSMNLKSQLRAFSDPETRSHLESVESRETAALLRSALPALRVQDVYELEQLINSFRNSDGAAKAAVAGSTETPVHSEDGVKDPTPKSKERSAPVAPTTSIKTIDEDISSSPDVAALKERSVDFWSASPWSREMDRLLQETIRAKLSLEAKSKGGSEDKGEVNVDAAVDRVRETWELVSRFSLLSELSPADLYQLVHLSSELSVSRTDRRFADFAERLAGLVQRQPGTTEEGVRFLSDAKRLYDKLPESGDPLETVNTLFAVIGHAPTLEESGVMRHYIRSDYAALLHDQSFLNYADAVRVLVTSRNLEMSLLTVSVATDSYLAGIPPEDIPFELLKRASKTTDQLREDAIISELRKKMSAELGVWSSSP